MRLIISPAKKMNVDPDGSPGLTKPLFLAEAERIKARLQSMSASELKALWRCNDQIAALNLARLETMDLGRSLTAALMAYEGIQYQYLAPAVLSTEALSYLDKHLIILSGFYGLLRPRDGIVPYRLEMQAKLEIAGAPDLYRFWGGKIAAALAGETDTVLNLASKEYSQAVLPHLPPSVRTVNCVFGEIVKDKVVEKGTLCKMARGEMLRFLAENGAEELEAAQFFKGLGFSYVSELSTPNKFVFIKA